MSYSTIYKVYKTKVTEVKDFSNGHGSGPALWRYIEKVLGIEQNTWIMTYGRSDLTQKERDDYNKLWSSYTNEALSPAIRYCFGMAHNYAIIKPKDIDKASEYCIILDRLIKQEFPQYVCSWGEIGECIKNTKLDKKCLGLGLNCTSVYDIWQGYNYVKGDKETFYIEV